ncbi:MAG: hypothetical protein AWU57_931 [Marinobacter sp. T13-3]|jgi:hypothetical protein|nr:MAG: hypothetical protein AWU57_931 [Marinobacter sp. T13-3]
MSTVKKPWIESLGYTKAQIEVIERAKTADDSVHVSGVCTSLKKSNIKTLVADLDAGEKSLKNCGKDD